MFLISRLLLRSNVQSICVRAILCKHCSTRPTKQYAVQPKNKGHNLNKKLELFGQPTAATHPHLMKEGELVPGIKSNEFVERRNRLMQCIVNQFPMKPHLIVIPSASKTYMTEKIPYVFRQNSDFLYLTGCLEPDSILIMFGNSCENYKSTIFVQKRDDHSELWDGPRTGVERAQQFYGVTEAMPAKELRNFLTEHLEKEPNIILWYDYLNSVHTEVHSVMTSLIEHPNAIKPILWENPRKLIHRLRLIKSPTEQKLMQESCNIASSSIVRAMEVTKPGVTEHQLFATVDYESRMRGAEILAYPPVVATGNNATIIHYIDNTQQTKPGDMVLMDAGCEYHGYVSDITRTWPVDGKFSEPQQVLYQIVLEVQLELIQLSRNLPSLDTLFHCMCRSIGIKLREAGVIPNTVPNDQLPKVAYEFCPHHVSHYLGMDVHDTALIPRSISLREGMVFTIEPGIYINEKNELARPEFKGSGIRIEDDILMTSTGPVVLSSKCPKEIKDIENIMSP